MPKPETRTAQSAPSAATPPAMRAAVADLDRRARARALGWFALGGGTAALMTSAATGVAVFLAMRYLRRR